MTGVFPRTEGTGSVLGSLFPGRALFYLGYFPAVKVGNGWINPESYPRPFLSCSQEGHVGSVQPHAYLVSAQALDQRLAESEACDWRRPPWCGLVTIMPLKMLCLNPAIPKLSDCIRLCLKSF